MLSITRLGKTSTELVVGVDLYDKRMEDVSNIDGVDSGCVLTCMTRGWKMSRTWMDNSEVPNALR